MLEFVEVGDIKYKNEKDPRKGCLLKVNLMRVLCRYFNLPIMNPAVARKIAAVTCWPALTVNNFNSIMPAVIRACNVIPKKTNRSFICCWGVEVGG
jgi:hypothetical protein